MNFMDWPDLSSENIAVFSNVPLWVNRHPEGLEVAWHYGGPNTIHWVNCTGSLASCPANSFHSRNLCQSCIKQTIYITSKLLPESSVVHDYQPERMDLDPMSLPSSFLELVDFHYGQVPIGGMVASQLADDARDRFFEWESVSERAINLLRSGIELYEWSSNFLSKNSITTVFVWNGRRPSDGPMVFAARDRGLKFFTIISDEIGKLRVVPDVSIHSSKGLEESLTQVKVKGLSGTDMVRVSEFLTYLRHGTTGDWTLPWFARGMSRSYAKSDNRPILAIFTSSPFEHVGLKSFAIANNLSGNVLDNRLEDICSRLQITSNWQVVVRLHPNLKHCGRFERSQIERLPLKFPGVSFIMPEDRLSSYDLLEQADVVVTFGSTIGVEASWYGKPSLLVGRAVHERAGVCTVFGSVDEMEVALMNRDFRVIDKDRVLQYLVAERNSHLPMEYIQMGSHYSYLKGIRLERGSFVNWLRGLTRSAWILSFRIRQAQLRWNHRRNEMHDEARGD